LAKHGDLQNTGIFYSKDLASASKRCKLWALQCANWSSGQTGWMQHIGIKHRELTSRHHMSSSLYTWAEVKHGLHMETSSGDILHPFLAS
jgi:hypothetical protein